MSAADQTPSFDEWVEYCFVHATADFNGDVASSDKRRDRFLSIEPCLLASYLVRFFESPGFVMERYTNEQIAGAVWFIFGIASGYPTSALSDDVPTELRMRLVRSITTVYAGLFDLVCNRRGRDPDTDLTNNDPVDRAVYMIWDMDQFQYAVRSERVPELLDAAIGVFEAVLATCRTSTCLISVLHGIGHMHDQANDPPSVRLRSLVDSFLATRRIPDWVREYAVWAHDGRIL